MLALMLVCPEVASRRRVSRYTHQGPGTRLLRGLFSGSEVGKGYLQHTGLVVRDCDVRWKRSEG